MSTTFKVGDTVWFYNRQYNKSPHWRIFSRPVIAVAKGSGLPATTTQYGGKRPHYLNHGYGVFGPFESYGAARSALLRRLEKSISAAQQVLEVQQKEYKETSLLPESAPEHEAERQK